MFSDRLKATRKNHSLSQAQLAERLSVSQQTIAAWERGTAKPDITMLKQLSQLFSVSTDYLLENQIYETADIHLVREEPAPYGSHNAVESLQELHSLLNELNSKEIEFLKQIIPHIKNMR